MGHKIWVETHEIMGWYLVDNFVESICIDKQNRNIYCKSIATIINGNKILLYETSYDKNNHNETRESIKESEYVYQAISVAIQDNIGWISISDVLEKYEEVENERIQNTNQSKE